MYIAAALAIFDRALPRQQEMNTEIFVGFLGEMRSPLVHLSNSRAHASLKRDFQAIVSSFRKCKFRQLPISQTENGSYFVVQGQYVKGIQWKTYRIYLPIILRTTKRKSAAEHRNGLRKSKRVLTVNAIADLYRNNSAKRSQLVICLFPAYFSHSLSWTPIVKHRPLIHLQWGGFMEVNATRRSGKMHQKFITVARAVFRYKLPAVEQS